MLDILRKVNGTNFGPINTAFLANEDYSNQYYYAGAAPSTSKDESYSQVRSKSLDDRNKSSMWTKSTSNNEIGVGVRVKFSCGGSAGGYIYPIFILVPGLSDAEMPSDNFIVVPVEGMTTNGHIDPRNRELGYVCFMKHDFKKYTFLLFLRNDYLPSCAGGQSTI